MKRANHHKKDPLQLEFEDLIAEAVDIGIRMRSFRRRDFIFCPLRIPGWQSSESLRCQLGPARVDMAWLEQGFERIRRARKWRDALTITASYLSGILDLDMEKTGAADVWRAQYPEYCGWIIEWIRSDKTEDTRVEVFFWETAKAILEAYDGCHHRSDWQILEYLDLTLPEEDDFEASLADSESRFNVIFISCLCYLYGWAEGDCPGIEADRL